MNQPETPGKSARVTIAHVSLGFGYKDISVTFAPLESLFLASVLRESGYDVDFRDFQIASRDYPDPQDPESFAKAFLADAAPVLLVLCTNDAFPIAMAGLHRFKQEHDDAVVILGGVAPVGVARQVIDHFPCVDVVVQGEYFAKGESASERTFVDVLGHLGNGLGAVDGVVFRADGKTRSTPPRPLVRDVSDLPLPAYDLIDVGAYDEVNIRGSWGCAYQCMYCDRHRQGRVAYRPLDALLEEISILRREYGQRHVFLYDEIFPLNRARTLEFCDRMARSHLDVTWSCVCRIDTIDNQLLDAMAAGGCHTIYYGVESGSDEVIARVKGGGGYTAKKAVETIEASLARMNVGTFFIWGFPFESMADFDATTRVVREVENLGIEPTIYVLSPHPMTVAYREYHRDLVFNQQVWDANWPRYLDNPASREILADLIRAYPDLFPGFYACDPNIAAKLRTVQRLGWETHFAD